MVRRSEATELPCISEGCDGIAKKRPNGKWACNACRCSWSSAWFLSVDEVRSSSEREIVDEHDPAIYDGSPLTVETTEEQRAKLREIVGDEPAVVIPFAEFRKLMISCRHTYTAVDEYFENGLHRMDLDDAMTDFLNTYQAMSKYEEVSDIQDERPECFGQHDLVDKCAGCGHCCSCIEEVVKGRGR